MLRPNPTSPNVPAWRRGPYHGHHDLPVQAKVDFGAVVRISDQ